jgi:hypothetical protein
MQVKMLSQKLFLPLPCGQNRSFYENWYREHLAAAKSCKFSRGKVSSNFFAAAQILSQLLQPPREIHEYIWKIIQDLGLADEVERVRKIFEEQRPQITNPEDIVTMSWISFPPFTRRPPSQQIDRLPISLAGQTFMILDGKPFEHPRVDWNGLTTCVCPRKSAQSIDILTQRIADDLRPAQEAVIIDFGSGGCLPLLPLITRLHDLKKITLYLIDPVYSENIKGNYLISRGSDSFSKETRNPVTAEDFSVFQFFRLSSSLLGDGQRLEVRIVQNAKEAHSVLEANPSAGDIPHVLYTMDPIVSISFINDFILIGQCLKKITEKPMFYCLNLITDPDLSLRIAPNDFDKVCRLLK